MVSIACIVIATRKREKLLDELVMPSVVDQGFDEVAVVGDYHSGEGYRHLPMPDITRTTVDAQIKRDVATAATSSEMVVYLSDDHKLGTLFYDSLSDTTIPLSVVGIPKRSTIRGSERIILNTGFPGYCGGHAGIFHRSAIREVPFSIAPHHPNWDVFHSHMLMSRGYELVELPDCMIEDVDPEGRPWL